MVGESCHLDGLLLAVGTLGEGDAQDFGSSNRIRTVCFVEVTTTEKQQCIRVLGLEVKKLLHHRGEYNLVFIHL